MNTVKQTLLALGFASLLTACGGGGGSSAANPGGGTVLQTSRSATLKLSTSGVPSAALAGIGVTVVLPDGVTPALNSDGSVAAAVATVSGVAATGVAATAPIQAVYTPSSGSLNGTLYLAMVSSDPAGFGVGEFATVMLVVAAGYNPPLSDFTLSGFAPVDTNYNIATGLTAAVANLSFQSGQ